MKFTELTFISCSFAKKFSKEDCRLAISFRFYTKVEFWKPRVVNYCASVNQDGNICLL